MVRIYRNKKNKSEMEIKKGEREREKKQKKQYCRNTLCCKYGGWNHD